MKVKGEDKNGDKKKNDDHPEEEEEEEEPTFYEDEAHLRKLCDFLRGKHGPPVREATMMDKRVHYIKGTLRNCRQSFCWSDFMLTVCINFYSCSLKR